jgi:hypothetical protein
VNCLHAGKKSQKNAAWVKTLQRCVQHFTVNTPANIQQFSSLSAVLGVHTHARNLFAEPLEVVQWHLRVKTLQRCVNHLTVNTLLNIQQSRALSVVLGVHTHVRISFAEPCGAVQRHRWVKTLQRCVQHLTVNTPANIQQVSTLSAVLGVHTHVRISFAEPCGIVQRHRWVKTLQGCVHHLTVNTLLNIQHFSVLSAVLGVHTHKRNLFAEPLEVVQWHPKVKTLQRCVQHFTVNTLLNIQQFS